jgi:hypothetical protein
MVAGLCPTRGGSYLGKDLLVRIDAARELRNRIAHDIPPSEWPMDWQTPILTLSLPKEADRMYEEDSQHLSFEELSQGLDELHKVIEDFKHVTARWSEWL